MHKYWSRILVAFAAMFILHASPAAAQATRTWVSGVGDDVNPCSRTAPCKTFAGAISKTAAGGEINCLDSGGFGAVTITKPMTIRCVGVEGGALAGGNGIVVNIDPTIHPNARVTLEGLDIVGVNPPSNGVRILAARDVFILDSRITSWNSATSFGVLVDGPNQISVVIKDSVITDSTTGIRVQSPGGNGTVRIYDSLVAGHAVAGISVTGTGNKVEIEGSQIIRAPKALDITAGGNVTSFGDNIVSSGDPVTTTVPKI